MHFYFRVRCEVAFHVWTLWFPLRLALFEIIASAHKWSASFFLRYAENKSPRSLYVYARIFGGNYQNFRLSWKAQKLITLTVIFFFKPKETGDDDNNN